MNQLLGFIRGIISLAVLTGHCIMGRHAESMQLPFNDFRNGRRSADEKETVNRFLPVQI